MNTTAKKGSRRAVVPSDLTAATPGSVKVLQVVSKRDGFRRAGRAWHGTTTVPLTELTEEQYNQLRDEPMLVTMLLDVPEESVGELSAADGLRVVGQADPELGAG